MLQFLKTALKCKLKNTEVREEQGNCGVIFRARTGIDVCALK
jgi:hypothetical protein